MSAYEVLYVLPTGFHRIRHYGLFAGAVRAHNIERARQLLATAQSAPQRRRAEADSEAENILPTRRCPCCGGRMIVVETFEGPSRLATPFAFVSTHAPEQEADVPTRSPMLLRPPRLRQTRVSSRPNTLAVVGPAG